MARRTHAEVAAAAVAAERVGLASFLIEHKRQVALLIEVGRCGADEADLLAARLDAFVGQVLIGLHVGGDGPVTRAAVRAALKAAGAAR